MTYVKNLLGSVGYVPETFTSSNKEIKVGSICELDPSSGTLENTDTGGCKFIVLEACTEDEVRHNVPCIRLLPGTVIEGRYTGADYDTTKAGTRLGLSAPAYGYEYFEKNPNGRFEVIGKRKNAQGFNLFIAVFLG